LSRFGYDDGLILTGATGKSLKSEPCHQTKREQHVDKKERAI
jgi:hypothetical protein